VFDFTSAQGKYRPTDRCDGQSHRRCRTSLIQGIGAGAHRGRFVPRYLYALSEVVAQPYLVGTLQFVSHGRVLLYKHVIAAGSADTALHSYLTFGILRISPLRWDGNAIGSGLLRPSRRPQPFLSSGPLYGGHGVSLPGRSVSSSRCSHPRGVEVETPSMRCANSLGCKHHNTKLHADIRTMCGDARPF